MKHQIRNPVRYYSSVFDFLNVRIIDTIHPLCRYAYTDWIQLYKYVHIGIGMWFGNSIFMSCISSTARALRRGVPEQDAWPAQSHWKDQAQHAKPEQWHSSYVYQLNKFPNVFLVAGIYSRFFGQERFRSVQPLFSRGSIKPLWISIWIDVIW